MAALVRGTPEYQDQTIERNNALLRHIVYASAAVIMILTAALVWQTLKPAAAPYVLTVNEQGVPLARLQPLPGTDAVADKTIRYAIDEYIQYAFAVSKDFGEEQAWLTKVYQLSGKPAAASLTAWYKTHSPLDAGNKGWTECQIERTLKYPNGNVYEVDYRTSRYLDREDTPVITDWRAFLTIALAQPTDANPLGVWILNIDFEQEQGK